MGRQPNGRPKIYRGADGDWHSYVTVGRKKDGALDRRHIQAKSAGEVAEKIDELQERRARGAGVPVKIETVQHWLEHWLEHVVRPRRAWKTSQGYETIIRCHIVPAIGQWRLDGPARRLEPEHLDAMYTVLGKRLAPSYVLQIHRVLRKALKDAVRRGKTSRNICDMIDPPTARQRKVTALNLTHAQAVIRTALGDELGARWLLALLLGLRQGEVLGLRWGRVHLDPPGDTPPYLELVTQTQRRTWQHGCADPVACAKPHCRRAKCPPRWRHGCGDPPECGKGNRSDLCPQREPVAGCRKHRSKCPDPCKPGCTGHARVCKQRTGGGLVDASLKSHRSERGVALGGLLTELLRQYRERQIREFAEMGREWIDSGHVFAAPNGGSRDPRRDHESWEDLLSRAGVPDARLHAARHTAGTFLVATGTDISQVQDILGHVDIRTTRSYVDVAQGLKREAVDRVAAALVDGSLLSLLQQNPVAQNVAVPTRDGA